MQPRPEPTTGQRILAEVMFIAGLLALAEVLVRMLDMNRLLITATILVVALTFRAGTAIFRRWGKADKIPEEPAS